MPRASERQARAELPRRLATVKQWLIDGVPLHQLHAYAAQMWNVSPRTVDKYLRKVGAEWAKAACSADYLTHLWLAKAQRDQLIDKLHRQISECTEPALVCRLIDLCHKLLKERDALMARLVQHRKETERDTSPSGEERVVMTRKEFNERFENHVFIEEYYARQEEYAKEFGASSGIPRLAKYVRQPNPSGERPPHPSGERPPHPSGERQPHPSGGRQPPEPPEPPGPPHAEGQTGTSAPKTPAAPHKSQSAQPSHNPGPDMEFHQKPTASLEDQPAKKSPKELARMFWGKEEDEDAELELLPPAPVPQEPPRRPKPW